jgi:hypothetical protein
LVPLQHCGVNLNVQSLSNALTVIYISPEKVAQLPYLDILPCSTQRSCDRLRYTILLIFRENPPEIACLSVVILIARFVALGNYIAKI